MRTDSVTFKVFKVLALPVTFPVKVMWRGGRYFVSKVIVKPFLWAMGRVQPDLQSARRPEETGIDYRDIRQPKNGPLDRSFPHAFGDSLAGNGEPELVDFRRQGLQDKDRPDVFRGNPLEVNINKPVPRQRPRHVPRRFPRHQNRSEPQNRHPEKIPSTNSQVNESPFAQPRQNLEQDGAVTYLQSQGDDQLAPQSKPLNVVPKPRTAGLGEVYRQIQVVGEVENPRYDQPLTEELFAHGETHITYDAELARVNHETDAMAKFMDPEEVTRQKRNNAILQQYRFGIIKSRDEAWRRLTHGVPRIQWPDLEGLLNGTTPVRPTRLTQEEARELGMYRQAVQDLYDTQSHGNSNCQSFANSMEHFMRGLGYQQVVGVMQQLDMNVKAGDPTPVACWNLPKYQEKNFCGFLEGSI